MKELYNRRSIRKFSPVPVSDEDITALLKAAMQAPSAGNEQPWEFVVIKDKETMKKIMTFHPYANMMESTPCVIVVCGNRSRQKFQEDYWVQDCSAGTQNILLEAVHLGLGAVWLGIYPVEERMKGMAQLLGLSEEIIPLCAAAVGHPAEKLKPVDRFQTSRVHYEKWNS